MPGGDLQTARKELREAKEWLSAVQKKNVPLSPRPRRRRDVSRPVPRRCPGVSRKSVTKAIQRQARPTLAERLHRLGPQVNGAARLPRPTRSNISWWEDSGRGSERCTKAGKSASRCVQDCISSGTAGIEKRVRVGWCSHPRSASRAERATRYVLDSRG